MNTGVNTRMNTRMKIGVLGSGAVGETLANGFLKKGHEVMRGSREPNKLSDWKAKAGSRASTGTFAETAAHGELVVLAVKGSAAEQAVRACGNGLAGKPPRRSSSRPSPASATRSWSTLT